MCGDCCKGYGGTFVRQEDIKAISEYLHIDSQTFLTDYCQWSGKRPVIKTADSGYCVFWDKVCTIHQVKPRMCGLWPFIEGVVADPSNWAAMHSMCPGIQKEVNEEALVSCVRQVLAERNR
jgi:Fe-S-cluster containining protein